MWEEIAAFLLEIPPIDEIGGKITHVIEQYRSGIIEKQNAIQIIIRDFKRFLEGYVELNEKINL
jgi:hypothetical protein